MKPGIVADAKNCYLVDILTKSDLEWKRNSRILVPIAPLGGSSNAVKARVDKKTFKVKTNKMSKCDDS